MPRAFYGMNHKIRHYKAVDAKIWVTLKRSKYFEGNNVHAVLGYFYFANNMYEKMDTPVILTPKYLLVYDGNGNYNTSSTNPEGMISDGIDVKNISGLTIIDSQGELADESNQIMQEVDYKVTKSCIKSQLLHEAAKSGVTKSVAAVQSNQNLNESRISVKINEDNPLMSQIENRWYNYNQQTKEHYCIEIEYFTKESVSIFSEAFEKKTHRKVFWADKLQKLYKLKTAIVEINDGLKIKYPEFFRDEMKKVIYIGQDAVSCFEAGPKSFLEKITGQIIPGKPHRTRREEPTTYGTTILR
jgi:hypothetical protein